tara:strand:- start:541 stop:852 length:312 start_codon:yes stop_codon:yes gene_type:complete
MDELTTYHATESPLTRWGFYIAPETCPGKGVVFSLGTWRSSGDRGRVRQSIINTSKSEVEMKNYADRDRKLNKRRRGQKSMKMDGKGTRTQYRQRIEEIQRKK